ncbi:6643_t:CDS:1 [Racocetra fulgida]|uniref:6643_t:CDS:1 n=1 Tax=Racocetra fulgida TaxID=60492 RepID=A0A9N9NU68_9GLOM|nr:6643_t:CDS:1 [Racocetra fulgida]
MTTRENQQLQKTTVPSLPSRRSWFFLDLRDLVIGRAANRVATVLRGKNRVDFFPNLDLGNYVVLINAQHLTFTGRKLDNKYYYNHSGYPGGLRKRNAKIMLNNFPTELVKRVIKGMMPHTKQARQQLKRLFIYPGDTHPHQAQEKNFIAIKI